MLISLSGQNTNRGNPFGFALFRWDRPSGTWHESSMQYCNYILPVWGSRIICRKRASTVMPRRP